MFSLVLMQKLLNINAGGLIFNRIEPKQVTVNTSSSPHTLSEPFPIETNWKTPHWQQLRKQTEVILWRFLLAADCSIYFPALLRTQYGSNKTKSQSCGFADISYFILSLEILFFFPEKFDLQVSDWYLKKYLWFSS